MVIDPNMNFSKVVVDPGNGEVLFNKQLSKEEHLMMHEMGERGMMMSPGMTMGGPGEMMKHDMGNGTSWRNDDGKISRLVVEYSKRKCITHYPF
jgi:hypothetical protein